MNGGHSPPTGGDFGATGIAQPTTLGKPRLAQHGERSPYFRLTDFGDGEGKWASDVIPPHARIRICRITELAVGEGDFKKRPSAKRRRGGAAARGIPITPAQHGGSSFNE